MTKAKGGARSQTHVYLEKCFRIFRNENGWKCFVSCFLITLIIALVTGEDMFCSAADTEKGIFAIVCACIWIGIFNSIQSICKERAIIKREHRTGSNISSYILAHVIYESVLSMGEALIIVLVIFVRNFKHFPTQGALLPAFLEIYIDIFLVVLASDMLGLLVSCIVKTEMTAMTVMPFILILQLVLAGIIFELSTVTNFLSYFTISRWGQAAICITSNIEGMTFLSTKLDYEFSIPNLLYMWGLLTSMIILLSGLSVLALSFVDSDQR